MTGSTGAYDHVEYKLKEIIQEKHEEYVRSIKKLEKKWKLELDGY